MIWPILYTQQVHTKTSLSWTPLSRNFPPCCPRACSTACTRRRPGVCEPRFERRDRSPGGPLCDSERHHVLCWTSTQRVVDPRWPCPERPRQISDSTSKKSVRSFFCKKSRVMCTIFVDFRTIDTGETLHLWTGAKLSSSSGWPMPP